MDIINIIIVDDHSLFRTGVRRALESKPDIRIVGEANNGQELLKLLETVTPHVITLGVTMPVMDGPTTLPLLKRLYPHIPIVIISMHSDYNLVGKMIDLGAGAYLTKEAEPELIYKAIRTCNIEGRFITEFVKTALNTRPRNKVEFHVLQLLNDGKTIEEISVLVEFSTRTVQAIVDKLKKKAGVDNINDLLFFSGKNNMNT